MQDTDFARIEVELGITLPSEYRRVMATAAPELVELITDYRGVVNDADEAVFLNPDTVIEFNLSERGEDAATGDAFPDWEQTFFLTGTNGAGDFYCLRLDNEPGVWMIGSDCGDEPSQLFESLSEQVESVRNEYLENMSAPEKVVAVPFFTEDEWEKLRATVPDAAALGDSYEKWEAIASDEYRNRRLERKDPQRILIDVEQFLEWCRTENRQPDAASRNTFAEIKLEAKAPWVAKYRRKHNL
jgi:hypothetical protein